MPDDSLLWDLSDDPAGPRLLHAGDAPAGKPYLYLSDNKIEIGAGTSDRHDKGIAVTPDFGTQITGPMSFSEMPQNIALCGGYYRLNPLLLIAAGSSSAMPIPTLVWGTPPILAASHDMADIAGGLGI